MINNLNSREKEDNLNSTGLGLKNQNKNTQKMSFESADTQKEEFRKYRGRHHLERLHLLHASKSRWQRWWCGGCLCSVPATSWMCDCGFGWFACRIHQHIPPPHPPQKSSHAAYTKPNRTRLPRPPTPLPSTRLAKRPRPMEPGSQHRPIPLRQGLIDTEGRRGQVSRCNQFQTI